MISIGPLPGAVHVMADRGREISRAPLSTLCIFP
jgi:hypothetical protein